jgi:hypothetical protein
MPRYVILEHDWPERHWDFLLEAGDVLRAWRLWEEPNTNRPVRAEANFDHRLLYLDYEGSLSGGRGRVTRWDAGTFEWLTDDGRGIAVELAGGRLVGQFQLQTAQESRE